MKKKENLDELIDHALEHPPAFELKMGFSRVVVRRMKMRAKFRSQAINTKTMVFTTGFALVGVILLALFLPKNLMFSIIASWPWVAVSIVLISMFQYLDIKLIRNKMHAPA